MIITRSDQLFCDYLNLKLRNYQEWGNYKLINHNTLRNDLAEELKDLPTFDAPVDDLIDIVETKIAEIIDHHAPEVV